MNNIATIFWDVGGVLLTNGWDTNARRRASDKFHLDWDDFQERHELISTKFEEGKLTLDEYLQCAIFHEKREFSRDTFREFMFNQSQPIEHALELLKQLATSGRYQLATLNNESRELNLYRIERFNFRDYFSVFFSSCFLGVKKPDKEIFQVALNVTQRAAEECLYIDDRHLNVEVGRRLGINAIHFKSPAQLQQDLQNRGLHETVK